MVYLSHCHAQGIEVYNFARVYTHTLGMRTVRLVASLRIIYENVQPQVDNGDTIMSYILQKVNISLNLCNNIRRPNLIFSMH